MACNSKQSDKLDVCFQQVPHIQELAIRIGMIDVSILSLSDCVHSLGDVKNLKTTGLFKKSFYFTVKFDHEQIYRSQNVAEKSSRLVLEFANLVCNRLSLA